MEAGDGIEPTHESFADSRITTLLSGHRLYYKKVFLFLQEKYFVL